MRQTLLSAYFLTLAATCLYTSCSDEAASEDQCSDCGDTSAFGVVLPDGVTADSVRRNDDRTAPVTVNEAIALLNAQRQASGIPAVALDDTLSEGCEAHIEYMIGEQKVVHEQEPTSQFYTAEGAETGPRSLIAGDVYDLRDALELWTTVIYHRISLLDAGTEAIGLAFKDGYACLDPYGLWNGENATAVATYPGNGQINVATTLSTDISPISPVPADWPGPNGTVVSISFPPTTTLGENVTIEMLSTTSGALISGIVRHPMDSNDPYASLMGRTVALVPRNPLEPSTTYRVEFIGLVDDVEMNRIWQFTTKANPTE